MLSWPRSHGAQESAVSFVTAPSRLRSVQMGVTVRRRTGGGGTGSCQSEQTRDATLTSQKARWLHLWRVYLSDRVCREQQRPPGCQPSAAVGESSLVLLGVSTLFPFLQQPSLSCCPSRLHAKDDLGPRP